MIFTFYSFKGGVGRSMALANVATIFQRSGLHVLIIDWDIEAPGLERFFLQGTQLDAMIANPGLVDIIADYKKTMTQWSPAQSDSILPVPEFQKYVSPIRIPEVNTNGKLWLMTAGRRDNQYFGQYAEFVKSFDWLDFYENWEGNLFFEWFRQKATELADVVLIDSRTGVTEIGGICTYQMADVVVALCAPSQQNLDGTLRMITDFTSPRTTELRGSQPLQVLVVPARVDSYDSTLLDNFQREFNKTFSPYTPRQLPKAVKSLWNLRIPYSPRYAYGEELAVTQPDQASSEDLASAYQILAQTMSMNLSYRVPLRIQSDEILRSYLEAVFEHNLYLDPPGAYTTSRQLVLEHQRVYLSRYVLREHEFNPAHPEPLTVEAAVERHPLIVLLGSPGSGKTKFVRTLALQAAQQLLHLKNTLDLRAFYFPILLSIADYAANRLWEQLPLIDFIVSTISRSLAFDEETESSADIDYLLRNVLDQGGCLVLVDGLDEVAGTHARRSIVQRIQDFVNQHQTGGMNGENRLIVTSRPLSYHTAPLGLNFVHFTIQETMDDAEIRRFLETWCRVVEDANAPTLSEVERQRVVDREVDGIMRTIKTMPGVRQIAANPLMLRTLALIHRTGSKIPQRRIELYTLAADTLERTWRTAQGIDEAELSILLRGRELPGLLGALAYWIHADKLSGIVTEREVEQILGAEWARLGRLNWDPNAPNAEIVTEIKKFLDAVRAHTGLFVERTPGHYGFMHLTFEEYYAARHLVVRMRLAPKLIRQHLHDPHWEEPILLALGFVGLDYPEDAAELVETAILATSEEAQYLGLTPSQHEDLIGRDYLFALRCLGDMIPVHTQTLDRLMARLATELTQQSPLSRFDRYRHAVEKSLIQIVNNQAAVAVLNNHLVSALADEDLDVRMNAAKSLGLLGQSNSEVVSILLQALVNEDDSVRMNAAKILGRLGQNNQEVLPLLIQALNDANSDVRGSAVMSLGHLAQSSQEVLPLLVQALNDTEVSVRMNAAESLGCLEQSTPEVVTALMTALTDEDRDVRLRAIESLGRLRQSTPEVVTALMTALNDEDRDVRFTAADTLERLGRSTPEVVTALTAALTHEDRDVRFTASDTLGRLGQSIPEVVTALTAALTHEDSDVRFRAADSLGRLGRGQQMGVRLYPIWQESISHSDSQEVRRNAIKWLAQYASNVDELLPLFRQALLDDDNDVRSAAAAGLAQFARRFPSHAAEIEKLLLTAITDPAFEARDSVRDRTGQDYAYDGLWQLIVGQAEDEDE